MHNQHDEKPWTITLVNRRTIAIEATKAGIEYVYVPNMHRLTLSGFTRLLATDRGPKKFREYAAMVPGFCFDGSSPRAAIHFDNEEVLVYPGRLAKK